MGCSARQEQQQEVVRNYLALSREFEENQLYRKARETLNLALEKFPDNPFVLSRVVNFYLRLDMQEKALEVVNRLIAEHGPLGFPYYLKGKILESRGELRKAIGLYRSALTHSKKDLYVLLRLIPLLIQDDKGAEALELLHSYEEIFDRPHLFAEFQAEALLSLGEQATAFNKLRAALQENPGNRRLLIRYLRLSILTGAKPPRDVYEILRLSVPRLARLEQQELVNLTLDFFLDKEKYAEALRLLERECENEAASFHWRKKKALILLASDPGPEVLKSAQDIFLENPTDGELQRALQEYFRLEGISEQWKRWVREALKRHSDRLDLFRYFCSLQPGEDVLSICELNVNEFLDQVRKLTLPEGDLHNGTYEKLPNYALEAFIIQVAVENRVPSPERVWAIIDAGCREKGQIPPFQLEDLEAAYPVWLYALNVYFLFKWHHPQDVKILPELLETDSVACILQIQGVNVEIDLTQVLQPENPRLKPLIKARHGFRWRWPAFAAGASVKVHGIPFCPAEKFPAIAEELYSRLPNVSQPQAAE